ncbi:unnamed protein product [Rotaria sp. Silwood2]|nr:unnamed protein product [Rotaria sp. Silwood2]CAF3322394.1 unnamed protein product [Rotaria sp. Silwood2]CAF3976526.1 unnamed protein product [Rotaria sp. Silwood2]CAF4223190.1 unnamed protein product [Rotaria sp. Silwood2]
MFAKISSAISILSHCNHTIDGVHVLILKYHQHINKLSSVKKPSNLMSLTQKNQTLSDNNGSKSVDFYQIMQENIAFKQEIANLNQLLFSKYQTENTLLNDKLIEDADQFFISINELNNQFSCMKNQYEQQPSCVQDFQANLYSNIRLKLKLIYYKMNKFDRENNNKTNDLNVENMEITIEIEPKLSEIAYS